MTTRSASWSPPVDGRRWALATLAGAALFVAGWALLHTGPFDDAEIVDTPVYREYGDAMLRGEVPYRDFDLEYPPAALPVFLVPALGSDEEYRAIFEVLMLACGLGLIAGVAYALEALGSSTRQLGAGVALAALAPLALGSLVLTRFDLWPAALAVWSLAALAAGRSRLGLGVLAVAAAAKLWPLVLLPLALVYVGRREGGRRALLALGVFAAAAAAIVLPFAVVAPEGLVDSVTRQTGRPLQIESLGAAVLLAGHRLGLYEPTVVSTFGSQNLSGSLPDALGTGQTALQVVAVVGVWVLFARGEASRERLFAGSAAAVAAFVAFGKVLSPQFLVWLIPLVPLVLAPLPAVAFTAALVLTQLWFPTRYWDYVDLGPEAWLVFARDLALVGLVGLLVAELSRRRPAAFRRR